MKTLHKFFVAALAIGFAVNANSQGSFKEEVESGAYYGDADAMWYDFRVSDSDPIDKKYSQFTLAPEHNAGPANGWNMGWPYGMDGNPGSITWDQTAGILKSGAPAGLDFSAYKCPQIKLGTPQIMFNVEKYPIIAIKFDHLPECGEGGMGELNQQPFYVHGGTVFMIVERMQTAPSGSNSDYWMWIPQNDIQKQALIDLGINVDNYLEVYENQHGETFHLFTYQEAFRRWPNQPMSTSGSAQMDFYINPVDVANADDYLSVEWVRCFYNSDDAKDYIEMLSPSSIDYITSDQVVSSEYYTVSGMKVDAPVSGINIVKNKMIDGTVKVTKLLSE